MKISERLALVDKIGRELQSRYSYDEIDSYLAAFQVDPPSGVMSNSKWIYAKAALKAVALNTVLEIAADLELATPTIGSNRGDVPRNWQEVRGFRLFISHVSKDKDKATRLKECLAKHSILGFVAHEDIHPTLEWQSEIERALWSMDAMVAVHTEGFSRSFWTQQEIGFALGRGIKVISLKMGEDPTGFISKRQALARRQRSAEQIAIEIEGLLAADPLTSARLEEAKQSDDGREALADKIPF